MSSEYFEKIRKSSISNKWLSLIVILVAVLGLIVGYILIPLVDSTQSAPVLVSTNNTTANNNTAPIVNTTNQNITNNVSNSHSEQSTQNNGGSNSGSSSGGSSSGGSSSGGSSSGGSSSGGSSSGDDSGWVNVVPNTDNSHSENTG